MSNPLYDQFGRGGGITDVAKRFHAFKNSYKGDPRQAVLQMLQSGQISQAQLNQFQQMANALGGILK